MTDARIARDDREKMAEETKYRSPRGYGQPQAQAAAEAPRARRGEDPLAELARLIGQEDPFAEFSSTQQRRPAVNGAHARPARPAAPTQPDRTAAPRAAERPTNGTQPRHPDYETPRRADVRSNDVRPAAPSARVAPARPEDRDYRSDAQRQPARPQPPRSAQARAAERSAYDDREQAAPSRAALNGRGAPVAPRTARDPRARYDDYEAQPASRSTSYADDPRSPRRAERAPEEARYSRARQQAPTYRDQYDQDYENDYDPDYVDDGYLPEHADDVYDEVPRRRRRWGLYAVIGILIACGVGVLVLGYYLAIRPGISGTPPVVTRPNTPAKVDPKNAPQTALNKPVQDRIGAAGPEQIQTREEQPADLTQTGPRATPFAPERTQTQQQTQPSQSFTSPPSQQPSLQQNAPAANPDGPRKVRTVTIRPDGTVVPNQAPSNSPAPLQLNNYQSQDAESPLPRANPNPNRPLAAVAPSPPPVATGNYVVQVASHKTQDEAQQAWASLRTQHPTIFNGRNADIRRVDLGDRGTFYRAMVGPMNREQANALCQNLKTAGGGCIVQQRN